jgi:hypothetical protein
MNDESKDLEKQLAEIRAKRAELEAKKAAREESEDISTQIARESRELRDAQALEDAEQKYGRAVEYGLGPADGRKLAVVHTDLGDVIVKRANHVLFKRFQDSGEATAQEFDKLVRPCLVHPDSTTFDRFLEEQPAILARVAGAVALLAGVRMKELSGKS